jgi:hypothetical protein
MPTEFAGTHSDADLADIRVDEHGFAYIDVPASTYAKLELLAAAEGCSVEEALCRSIRLLSARIEEVGLAAALALPAA